MSIPLKDSLPPKFFLLSLQHSSRAFGSFSHSNFLLSLNPHFLLYIHPDPEEVATRILKRNRCGIPIPMYVWANDIPVQVRRISYHPSRTGNRLLLPSIPGTYWVYRLADGRCYSLILSSTHFTRRKIKWNPGMVLG